VYLEKNQQLRITTNPYADLIYVLIVMKIYCVRIMIYNPDAIDYSAGVVNMPDGTIKPNKVSCWVDSIEEIMMWRQENGKR
jgi:hypothetical protein